MNSHTTSVPRYRAILPSYIDSTMMSCFRSCPRKFYHEFLLGLRPGTNNIHLHAGGCFAVAIEHFYQGIYNDNLTTNDALKAAFGAYVTAWGTYDKDPSDSPKSFDRIWEAVHDYVATYPPMTDHVQPYRDDNGKVTSEFSFAIPLDDPSFPRHPETNEPFIYTGRCDLLGRYHDAPCVRDEKTASYAGAKWAQQWDLRAQFMGYVWACQQSGIPLKTVVVRGVVILKTKIGQVEAVKEYPDYMIERWHTQLRSDLWRLVECWKSGYFDYNFGETCTAYGNCIFLSVCRAREPEVWMNEYAIRRWDPLLRVPVADATEPVNQPPPPPPPSPKVLEPTS